MKSGRSFQVSEVATIASVSVRALHHYDEIGLLVPRGRTQAGYRFYDENDLLRLQQIVIGRALGLPLEEIRNASEWPPPPRMTVDVQRRSQRVQAGAKV
jgi:MerR family transcriptional regulator, thiopeptide resistance regulator